MGSAQKTSKTQTSKTQAKYKHFCMLAEPGSAECLYLACVFASHYRKVLYLASVFDNYAFAAKLLKTEAKYNTLQ